MWRRVPVTGCEDAMNNIRQAGRFGGHLVPGDAQDGALGLLKTFGGEGDHEAINQVVEYAHGDYYQGQVLRGVKEGRGSYHWANGAVYEGDWVRNVPCGDGKYSWPDGEGYEGAFKHGRRHGSGVYKWSNGASFVGIFRDDVPVGKGICTLPGGRCFHGEYRLFAAYLKATDAQRGRKQADAWVAQKWTQSSDLLRNPPWLGFTEVRQGRTVGAWAGGGGGIGVSPALTPKELSIGWPKPPFEKAEALDLADAEASARKAPPLPVRRVGYDWPMVAAPPAPKVEEDVTEEKYDDLREWRVGDVCECLDVICHVIGN